MQHVHVNPDAPTPVVHYWQNLNNTGASEGFKFKR
jgi:hypothetical protein